jgi:hypothetical protein
MIRHAAAAKIPSIRRELLKYYLEVFADSG